MAKATRTIRQTTFILAKSEEVYKALTDPKTHSAFTGAKATGRPKVEKAFTAWDGYISGRYLKLQKGKRIVQEWRTTEWPKDSPPSIVDFTFKEKKGGTELTLVHSRVPTDQAASYRQGWIDAYWKPLKEYSKKKATTHGKSAT
jgi:activator of HSP90 ATPase